MTLHAKRALLLIVSVLAIGAFFWMRSLVSWRPVKLAQVDRDYYQGLELGGFGWLSNDEQVAFFRQWSSAAIIVVALRNPNRVLWRTEWTYTFSIQRPQQGFVFDYNDEQLFARELKSGRVRHTFLWPLPSQQHFPTVLLAPDGKTIWAVDAPHLSCDEKMGTVWANDTPHLFQWDVQSGRLLRQIKLTSYFGVNDYSPAIFCLSPDGAHLVGCYHNQIRLWELVSGKESVTWTASVPPYFCPDVFSPDRRIVTYRPVTGTGSTFCLETTTGKVKWQNSGDSLKPQYFCDQEIVVPQIANCQILDLLSGHIKKELAHPRQSDGDILRVTHDWIYTLTPKGEILRWRAR